MSSSMGRHTSYLSRWNSQRISGSVRRVCRDATKKKLAVAVYNHYKRIQMNKNQLRRGGAVQVEYSAGSDLPDR